MIEAMSKSRLVGALIVSLLMSLTGIVAVFAGSTPGDPHSAAAIFPPWWPAAKAFEAAGSAGEVARIGAFSSVLVVHSKEPALVDRLRKAGALVVLDPVQLAACDRAATKGNAHD